MFLNISLQVTKSKSRADRLLLRKPHIGRKGVRTVPHRCTSSTNKQQSTYLILAGDFNAKLSKWCPSDEDNKAYNNFRL